MDSTWVITPKGKLLAFLFSFGTAFNNHFKKQLDGPNFPIHPRTKIRVRKTARNALIFPISNFGLCQRGKPFLFGLE